MVDHLRNALTWNRMDNMQSLKKRKNCGIIKKKSNGRKSNGHMGHTFDDCGWHFKTAP